MTDTVINSVNKDVLKSFKTLQKNKSILYTIAANDYLVTTNNNSMIIYDNPNEIDFEGTFKLARNKLIPVEYKLETDPKDLIDLKKFEKLKTFDKDLVKFQKFCYEQGLTVNIAEIVETLNKLLNIYKSFTLYKNIEKNEVMFVFNNNKHKCFLLSKLI